MQNRGLLNRVNSLKAVFLYSGLLLVFWWIANYAGVLQRLGPSASSAFVSFALLLAPLLAFGFGAAGPVRASLDASWKRVLAPSLLAVPYLIFAAGTGSFRWSMALAIVALPVGLSALLEYLPPTSGAGGQPRLSWQDGLTLATIAFSVMSLWLRPAWPVAGLGGMPKLLLTDVALYLYIVVRPLSGIGYDLRLRWADFTVGLREWLFFAPIAISLGLLLHFLHVHALVPSPWRLLAGLLTTFFFVAVPEELFFRGILENLLQTRFRVIPASLIASVLFGLSHFNKGALFNWRYVLLASIAGIFYGRAWRQNRRIGASAITHTMIDVVWSIWFR